MRRTLLTGFLAVLTACGSSIPTTGTTPPPPPPPPPSSTPASVIASAGDGQQALPGFPVTVNPAVIVKDASGAPVSGASVTFAVDSGGGSVSGGTVTTGSNGVATVGGWILGPTEGRNVLRVVVGALSPLRIVASASAAATVTFPAMSIGTGGGSIAINQTGPLNGFNLTLPGAAYPVASQWTVSYASNAPIPRSEGVNPISPLIEISGSVGSLSNGLLTLTIPVTVPDGMVPFIVLRDPVTGNMEVLLTLSSTSTSVTAATHHLNGARLLGRTPGGAGLRASMRISYDIEVFVDALTTKQLDLDVDTKFRPGVDDWNAYSLSTPNAMYGNCAGVTITAMWYYLNHSLVPGPLFNQFTMAQGVPLSNRSGNRWATLIQSQVEASDYKTMQDFMRATIHLSPTADYEGRFYDVLKAQMLVTRLPQFVVVSNNSEKSDVEPHAVIAWKIANRTIYLADPNLPGNLTNSVTYNSSTGFSNYISAAFENGKSIVYNVVMPMGASQVVPMEQLDEEYPSVVDGTIGADPFPSYTFNSKYGVIGDTLWLSDKLTIWTECASCHPIITSPDAPEAVGSIGALWGYQRLSASTWNPLSDAPDLVTKLDFTIAPVGGYTTGNAVYVPIPTPGDKDVGWTDWRFLKIIKLGAAITPVPLTTAVGVPSVMTVQVTGKAPGHVLYRWDFGDPTGTVDVTDNPSVTHTYQDPGSYTVKVVLIMPDTKQPIANATTVVTVLAPFVQLSISGNWPNHTAPSLGEYRYTDLHGSRAANAAAGIDALLIDFDPYTTDNVSFNFGITVVVVVPAGSALHAGQTFTKWVSGTTSVGVGQFNLALAGDLAHPENGTVPEGNFGTFTITAVYPLSDGSTALSFTFSVSNGVGGTITGSGVWGYR